MEPDRGEWKGNGHAIPLIAPQPPRLSRFIEELSALETSGVYSNYGPINTAFEGEVIEQVFGGVGTCTTVCNATMGLMIAIRDAVGDSQPSRRCYALMPSFTFAAAAQAAVWCGLTPLFCDIDTETWLPDEASERELLERFAGQVAVIVPYATFGNHLDLTRYDGLASEYGVPIVVDAAASLGCLDATGRQFGAGSPWPIVFSMHATKAFSVGEGGLIYSADDGRIERLRKMACFGFSQERVTAGVGLNAKMSELTALVARLQLRSFDEVIDRRESLADCYAAELCGSLRLQRETGLRQIRSFLPVLLPEEVGGARGRIVESLKKDGIGTGTYFSPHAAEHAYFRRTGVAGALPVTEDIARRVLSLPLPTQMTVEQVRRIAKSVHLAIENERRTGCVPQS